MSLAILSVTSPGLPLPAIAGGASRLNEIATKTGLVTSGASSLLSSLIELGIVRKEIPVTEVRSKKTLYQLEDSMFSFWYRFVRPNISGISRGMGVAIFKNQVRSQLNHFMRNVFEEIGKQYLYLRRFMKGLPLPMVRWDDGGAIFPRKSGRKKSI